MLTGNVVFDAFVEQMSELIQASNGYEPDILSKGQLLLGTLVATDTWLPSKFAESHPDQFRQYLLHRDRDKRFSIISVVFAPGQGATPHNHTVWGLIGQLRGAELTRHYEDPKPGEALKLRSECVLKPGQTAAVSPTIGDIHDVSNVADGISVSIHVYGADLGSIARYRSRFDADSGAVTPFTSSYH